MRNKIIEGYLKEFHFYEMLGRKTINILTEEQLLWKASTESNSIGNIVHHIAGNMISRWTDFLTTDGEKEWRNRDNEFEDVLNSKENIFKRWEEGWKCLFTAIESLTDDDLSSIIYIRNQGHTVQEAINRQLAHYPYHIGQLVFIGKLLQNENWESLSIPKGGSKVYNKTQFDQGKRKEHFTDKFRK